jgi:DUF4097 and DUF4098 domain-containing protein YvlB
MKEETQRIMKLVQEGKLSPEDAAELIDAMHEGASEETKPQTDDEVWKVKVKGITEAIDSIGKGVSGAVNWQDVGKQIRQSVKKGLETAKVHIEHVGKGGWFGATEEKDITLPLPSTEGKTLKIEGYSGDIQVVGGQSEGKIIAHAIFRASDDEEAKRKAEEYTLVVEESDHAIIIRQPSISGLTVDIKVMAPGKISTEARTHSGDVSVVDTGMSTRVASQSGDVHIKGVEGMIEVNLNTGDVTLEDAKSCDVAIENRTGDVTLRRVDGNVNVRSATGDLRVLSFGGGTASLESVSGDISVDTSEPISKTFNVRTVNGDALVNVPDGSDCRVSLSTLNGDASCDIKLEDEARAGNHITGRLGSGSGNLDVSAVNGDVTLKQRIVIATETV